MNREVQAMLAWWRKNKRLVLGKRPPKTTPNSVVSGGGKVRYVQVPSGGLAAMSGVAPEETEDCELLEIATEAGTGYAVGDFIRTTTTLTVRNYTEDVHGDNGMRIVQIFYNGNPSAVQEITGHSCTNTGSPTDIKDK